MEHWVLRNWEMVQHVVPGKSRPVLRMSQVGPYQSMQVLLVLQRLRVEQLLRQRMKQLALLRPRVQALHKTREPLQAATPPRLGPRMW